MPSKCSSFPPTKASIISEQPYAAPVTFVCETSPDKKALVSQLETPNDTYLDGFNDFMERLEHYVPGGYHPIHYDDTLGPDGRYRVVYKLGYGGSGTVWLCRDTKENKYVAVKVLVANRKPEDIPDLKIHTLDLSIPGGEYISVPIDSFAEVGPNGTHQCIVLSAIGPRVSPEIWTMTEKDPGPILKGMAKQAAQAMACLHKNGICHGDFRPANILVKLSSFDHLSEDELIYRLGDPGEVPVYTVSGDDLPDGSPDCLTQNVDLLHLGSEFLTDQICVIDFGESFPISSPPANLGTPKHYLPPEVLLRDEHCVGVTSDLWALGCTLFEIRQQVALFYYLEGADAVLTETVRLFGELRKDLWEKWDKRKKFFDEDGVLLRDKRRGETKKFTLEYLLAKRDKLPDVEEYHCCKRTTFGIPEDEQKLIADLLYKIFRHNPEERLSAENVVAHKWFSNVV